MQGTENKEQWIDTLAAEEECYQFFDLSVYILKGFRAESLRIYRIINPKTKRHKDNPIDFAGHSRGGGLA
jgi:predicted lipase